jgi:hypothetical protein
MSQRKRANTASSSGRQPPPFSGDDLFKPVPIYRMTQMEPAQSGPLAFPDDGRARSRIAWLEREAQEREQERKSQTRRMNKLERRLSAIQTAVEAKAEDAAELKALKTKVRTLAEHGSVAGKKSGEARAAKAKERKSYATDLIIAAAANRKLSHESIADKVLPDWTNGKKPSRPWLMALMTDLAKDGRLRLRQP